MNTICWSEIYANNIGIAKKCCTKILGTEFHDQPETFGNHFKTSCFSPSENMGYMPLGLTIEGVFFLLI